jgi:NACHT domain
VLATLLGRVVSGPIDRRTRQLGELLDAALGRRTSPYGRYYRQHVRESLRFTQTMGLAIVGPFTPELDDVYVDVGLAPRPPSKIPGHLLGELPQDVTTRYSVTELLDREKPDVLAVIGAPGSGKTTLLRNVARRAAAGERGRRRNTPILLVLRDHAVRIAENPRVDLPTLLRSDVVTLKAKEPGGWWEHQLHDGRCLILLDGLDEVAVEEHRRAVVDWIGQQVAQYPNNHYVVTSRPHGYRTAAITGATVLQVLPFTSDQVRRFLYGWYAATERFATSTERDDERAEVLEHIESRAREQANDLLRRLAEVPALYDLTINPLLLTMIANVHRWGGALPGSRAGLYWDICQAVLWRRRAAVNLPVGLPGAGKERLLASVAYEMMRRRVRDLAPADVAGIVEPGLRRMSETATVDDFLAEAQASGLVIERERHTYAFAHHTFGEHLAARHIRDNGLQSALIGSVNDAWWRETTLLYVTDADADEVVSACLDAATVTSLALAFECQRAGGELAPTLRERLSQMLTEATRASDPERRRLAAGVLATLQLSAQVTTTAGSRICTRPVSTELYELFLHETGNPPPDGVDEFVASPERPVTGVWASDATAFTRWVNDIVGASADAGLYRLPRTDEVDDLGQRLASASVISVWVGPGPGTDGSPQMWRPGGPPVPDPHTLTRSELVTAVSADVAHRSGLPSLIALNFAVARALAIHLAPDLARDLDSADLDSAIDLARDLDSDLDSALDLAPRPLVLRGQALRFGGCFRLDALPRVRLASARRTVSGPPPATARARPARHVVVRVLHCGVPVDSPAVRSSVGVVSHNLGGCNHVTCSLMRGSTCSGVSRVSRLMSLADTRRASSTASTASAWTHPMASSWRAGVVPGHNRDNEGGPFMVKGQGCRPRSPRWHTARAHVCQ